MWHDLLMALALLLVIEGVFPFLNPTGLRRAMLMISEMDNRQLRLGGLTSMVIGVLLMYGVNW